MTAAASTPPTRLGGVVIPELSRARDAIEALVNDDVRVFQALTDYFADRDLDADAEDIVRCLDEAIFKLKSVGLR